MHAPFLGLKVNRPSNSLQENFEGKGQGQVCRFYTASALIDAAAGLASLLNAVRPLQFVA
jgi:hypothetical protein